MWDYKSDKFNKAKMHKKCQFISLKEFKMIELC